MNSSPHNSSYERVHWDFPHLLKFLRNLWYWADGFMHCDSAKRRRFVRWSLRNAKIKMTRRLRNSPAKSTPLEMEELLDRMEIPKDQRRLWESHMRALDCHYARPYNGKVLLLRTREHPLKCSFDSQCGWGELARGGVSVHVLPGMHDSLLEEPNVAALAREVKIALDAI